MIWESTSLRLDTKKVALLILAVNKSLLINIFINNSVISIRELQVKVLID